MNKIHFIKLYYFYNNSFFQHKRGSSHNNYGEISLGFDPWSHLPIQISFTHIAYITIIFWFTHWLVMWSCLWYLKHLISQYLEVVTLVLPKVVDVDVFASLEVSNFDLFYGCSSFFKDVFHVLVATPYCPFLAK